jgi:hypothetical protein
MNKYSVFLETYSEILSAFSWSQYRIHGAGIIVISFTRRGTVRVSWRQHRNCSSKGMDLCQRCEYAEQSIAHFPDGTTILFTPPTPPPEAFYKIGGQWQEFILNKSANFSWG